MDAHRDTGDDEIPSQGHLDGYRGRLHRVVPSDDTPGSSSRMSPLGKRVGAKRELSRRYQVPGLLVGDSQWYVNT